MAEPGPVSDPVSDPASDPTSDRATVERPYHHTAAILLHVLCRAETRNNPGQDWLKPSIFLVPCTRDAKSVRWCNYVLQILLDAARNVQVTKGAVDGPEPQVKSLLPSTSTWLPMRRRCVRLLSLSLSWALALMEDAHQAIQAGTFSEDENALRTLLSVCRDAMRLVFIVIHMDTDGKVMTTGREYFGDGTWMQVAMHAHPRTTWALGTRGARGAPEVPVDPISVCAKACLWSIELTTESGMENNHPFLQQMLVLLVVLVQGRQHQGLGSNMDFLKCACYMLHKTECQVTFFHCVALVVACLNTPTTHLSPVLSEDLVHALVSGLLQQCLPPPLAIWRITSWHGAPGYLDPPRVKLDLDFVQRCRTPDEMFGGSAMHIWAKAVAVVGHLWHCLSPEQAAGLRDGFFGRLEAPIQTAMTSTCLASVCGCLNGWNLAVGGFADSHLVPISNVVALTRRLATLVSGAFPAPLVALAHTTLCRTVTMLCSVARPEEHRSMLELVETVQTAVPEVATTLYTATRGPVSRWDSGARRPLGLLVAIIDHRSPTSVLECAPGVVTLKTLQAFPPATFRYYLCSPFNLDGLRMVEDMDMWAQHFQRQAVLSTTPASPPKPQPEKEGEDKEWHKVDLEDLDFTWDDDTFQGLEPLHKRVRRADELVVC